MSIRQLAQLKEAHGNLQQQYNQLLTKNQNDLIAIRKKEKAINAIIQQLKQQRQKIRQQMQKQINTLKARLQQLQSLATKNKNNNASQHSSSTVSSPLIIASYKNSQSGINKQQLVKLKEDNKNLLSENNMLIKELENLKKISKMQIQLLSQQFDQQQQKVRVFQHQIKVKAEQVIKKQDQIQQMTAIVSKFEEQFKNMQIGSESEKAKQVQKILDQKLQEIEFTRQKIQAYSMRILILQRQNYSIHQEMIALKSKKCNQCAQVRLQLQLQKQILKSSQIMLRAKQMELQRIKSNCLK